MRSAKATAMHERIDIDPNVMQDKAVIRGDLLRKLGTGVTAEETIVDQPRPSADDIRATHAFAADDLTEEEIVFG